MAKAVAVQEAEESVIERAGDAMLMLISRSMWETLQIQGRAEDIAPAQVLDKALRAYLEEHASPETVKYLHLVQR